MQILFKFYYCQENLVLMPIEFVLLIEILETCLVTMHLVIFTVDYYGLPLL